MSRTLRSLPGVAEVTIDSTTQVSLKVDSKIFKQDDAIAAMKKSTWKDTVFTAAGPKPLAKSSVDEPTTTKTTDPMGTKIDSPEVTGPKLTGPNP